MYNKNRETLEAYVLGDDFKYFQNLKYLPLSVYPSNIHKDWIVEYIVLEIKALLKNTNMNIQEIAVKTNFANQSSLGRFFRKHTGMSLSQYRMSNLG